jgi:hypothetical protein
LLCHCILYAEAITVPISYHKANYRYCRQQIIDSTKFLLKNALPTPLGGCRHPENKYQIYQEVSDILLEGDWLDEFAGDFEVIPRDIQRME